MSTMSRPAELDITVSRESNTWSASAFEILADGRTGDMCALGVGDTRAAALADLAQKITD